MCPWSGIGLQMCIRDSSRLTQAIGETGEEFRFADFETDEECSMQSMADALAGE